MRTKPTQHQTDTSRRTTPTARLLASAIASQEIEGLHLSPQAAAEFREIEAGTLSLSDLHTRLLERYRRPSTTG